MNSLVVALLLCATANAVTWSDTPANHVKKYATNGGDARSKSGGTTKAKGYVVSLEQCKARSD